MTTTHTFLYTSAEDMSALSAASVDLIVTSPPYPMIEMWDDSLAESDPEIAAALGDSDGERAFVLMHAILDRVWRESWRVLKPGGFLCVNIGDATRKVGDNFRLYTNHSRITSGCESVGFQSLPPILWRKQTNAPNKFMGSGMLPAGAYVTLEHEYILIFRRGDKRDFIGEDRDRRRKSAFFWEERNLWFSDLWDFKGTRQRLANGDLRSRSAAFPLVLPERLILMYSLQGDVVLDPFAGTGTTAAAGIMTGRNTIGYEIDEGFAPTIGESLRAAALIANEKARDRLRAHLEFVVTEEARRGRPLGYKNERYGFPVMTKQEVNLTLTGLRGLEGESDSRYVATHDTAELTDGAAPRASIPDPEPAAGSQMRLSFD